MLAMNNLLHASPRKSYGLSQRVVDVFGPSGAAAWVMRVRIRYPAFSLRREGFGEERLAGGRRAVSLRFRIRSASLGRGCMGLVAFEFFLTRVPYAPFGATA